MLKMLSFFRSVMARPRHTTAVDDVSGFTPAAPGRIRIEPLPTIEIETSTNHHQSFTSPNPDIKATIYSSDRTPVGRVTYAVSPLFDRLYIFDVTIHEPYRRQGFGLAAIEYLATTYCLPMATIKEVSLARHFWRAARAASDRRGEQIGTLSISEMFEERKRWGHLKPQIDQLNTQISDRLIKHETWESAVGRGLPDWPSSTPQGRGAGAPP
ncbi:GNAT family N-acetyltransferase [Rugamonas aquatica]|uniref:N-acetyltransferase domain-containing protein n=1 Tax=Rugamonas aquatica TaxID=2743357 RepID=A0A6A7N6W4_9BURK|nr:GNAT family N-acetyltransferase [Rugamonas aquatica]MQA40671.1 hypothetical protein [Rugamonas aquatica]